MMPEQIKVIVVPCYNEVGRLVVTRFTEFAVQYPDWKLLFVDDGSTDSTWNVLQSMIQCHAVNINAIKLNKNSGKAEAVRQGVLAAIAEGAAIVGYWDADLATPLNEVERFYEVLLREPTCDMVLGSRVRLLGRHIERRFIRHLLGRCFATVASLILGLPVYDTQCGAKLMRVTPAIYRAFETPFISRWIFDVEVIGRYLAWTQYRWRTGDCSLVEVPLQRWADVAGSKLTARSFAKAGFDLLRIWRSLTQLKIAVAAAAANDCTVLTGTASTPLPADKLSAAHIAQKSPGSEL